MKMNAIIGIIPINGMIYYVVDDAVEALGYHSTSEAAKLLPAEDTYTLSIHGSVDANMLLLTNLHGLEILEPVQNLFKIIRIKAMENIWKEF